MHITDSMTTDIGETHLSQLNAAKRVSSQNYRDILEETILESESRTYRDHFEKNEDIRLNARHIRSR
jgi:hypothetical protein